MRLEPVFAEAATANRGAVHFAKVDATVEKALAARFPISGYPTLFYIRSGSVRVYNGARTVAAINQFVAADGGIWSSTEVLSYWSSPFGPVGKAKATVVMAGYKVFRLYEYMLERGVPNWAAVSAILASGFLATCVFGAFFSWLSGGGGHDHED